MNKLRQFRKQKGLTLKEVAEDVGIADNTLQQYETEKREPKKETLIKKHLNACLMQKMRTKYETF